MVDVVEEVALVGVRPAEVRDFAFFTFKEEVDAKTDDTVKQSATKTK